MSNNTEDVELATQPVRMKKNGDLVQRLDGTEVVVAHYDRASGSLEFETKENSVKLYNQVTAKIGTVNKGTMESGLVIRNIWVKGEPRPDAKKLSKRPKLGQLGDSAEDYVRWMIDNDINQAIRRYGIYVDKNGVPIRKHARRVLEQIVDRRETTDDRLPWVPDGNKTQSKSPVAKEHEVVDVKDAIIARRATALTFTPQEVVGGFQPDDDFEDESVEDGGDE